MTDLNGAADNVVQVLVDLVAVPDDIVVEEVADHTAHSTGTNVPYGRLEVGHVETCGVGIGDAEEERTRQRHRRVV